MSNRRALLALLAAGAIAAAAATDAGAQALAASPSPTPTPKSCDTHLDPLLVPPSRSRTLLNGVAVSPSSASFAQGETLVYSAKWKGIHVGDVTSVVDPSSNFDGRPAMHLHVTAVSAKSFSWVFKIDDVSESWIDPVDYSSMGYLVDQKEGSNLDKQTWTLDNGTGIAHRTRTHNKKDGTMDTYDTDCRMDVTHVQDAHSMTYFYRLFPLKPGDVLESDVFTDKQTWKLKVSALSRETVKTPAGTFTCIKLKPEVSLNGVPQQKGALTVWVTDDAKRIPVKVQSSTPLGPIDAVLLSWTQGPAAVADDPKPSPTK